MSQAGRGGGESSSSAMTRRAATTRASRSVAEQLENTLAPQSDTERGGGVMFGEPSTPRSNVRVTYGAKRKYKDPPPRSDVASDAGGSLSRTHTLAESSPNKLPTDGGASSRRGERGRSGRSSRARSTSPGSSIENKSLVFSDPEIIVLDDDPDPVKPLPRRNTVGATDNSTINPTAPKAGASNGKSPRKRALSLSSAGSDSGGDLTPLSSPEVVKKKVFPPTTNIAPRLARQFLRAQTQAQLPAVSEFKQAPISQSKSLDNLFAPLDSTDDESFDEAETGSLVWVSIDLQGRLTDCDEKGEEDTLWWPAKVEVPKPLMRVLLLGEPPGPEGQRRLSVSNPSASNVRSMMLDGRLRFDDTNYRPSRGDTIRSSPRKKRKLDIETAWQEARDVMVKMDEESDHDLLATSTRYGTTRFGSQKNGETSQAKGKAKAVESDLDDDLNLDLGPSRPQRRWRAPSANPLLEIPGELVLAKEGKTRTQYWPAKLLEYIRPLKQSQKPKYKVIFFDGTVSQIEADWFWTTSDDEFATCKLGESTGNYGLDHDNDILDELEGAEDFNLPFAPEDEATLRAPSPLPELPAPKPETFEYDLEVAEEFEYIKPVLAAVLDNEYGPAKARHEGFMRGGGARRKVLDAIPLRGSLSAKEKEEVAYYVRSWARRRERRREMGLSVDYPRDKLYLPADSQPAKPLSRGHESDRDSVLTDISAVETELLVLSEGEAPPSSFVATDIGTDDERDLSVRQDHPEHEVSYAVPEDAINVSQGDTSSEEVLAQINGTAEVAPDSNEIAVDAPAPAAPRMSYHDLDPLEKLTYCNNVLLQEAILQILLWRTGQRKELGLLSPREEQRLHGIATEEGEKTNWVHDIIRMRQAMEKTMLPSSKQKGKATNAAGGSRTRTRRGGT
ncbi:hypothetical protein L227DRAFT_570406 [Lentinus tigrinus ALCF2SS1-6]|uniref:Uncharacterized protein n=1 Tax=Lentinus tigrinus ALCF2SS1-6 TaxID=1328759 RepID=A0A5C2SRQ9_9APHY|nr:hypothetical protein L227DRAFT_570406 [Lentinus tigrinus ALCF2SS1-6]